MQLRVCGCHGGETRDAALTGFVIDGVLALDAGSLTRALTLDEQLALEHLLITHSHLDHVKDLAFLSINRLGLAPQRLRVHANRPTLDAARRYLLCEPLWLDTTVLLTPEDPVIELIEIVDETPFTVGPYRCLGVATNHPVPGSAFLVGDGRGTICFTGDTGPTDRLWQVLNATADLRALIMEVSFPDELAAVAHASGHLTPRALAAQVERLVHRGYPILLTHLKPGYEAAIHAEVAALGIPDCQFLADGQVLEL